MTQTPEDISQADIECVAKALMIEAGGDPDTDTWCSSKPWFGAARVAIEAMLPRLAHTPARVPREAMGEHVAHPKVYHVGTALQGIADEHADVLHPRQIEALYQAANYLWDEAALDAAPQSEGECELCGDTGLCGFDPGPQFCNCKAGRGAIAEYRRHEALSRHAPQSEGVGDDERAELAEALTEWGDQCEGVTDDGRTLLHRAAAALSRPAPAGQRDDIRAATIEECARVADAEAAKLRARKALFDEDTAVKLENQAAVADRAAIAIRALAASTGAMGEGERAQIVAWLRQQTGHPEACEDAQRSTAFYSSVFADSIEAGEHVAALSPKPGEVRP